jgi:hypothetical protein
MADEESSSGDSGFSIPGLSDALDGLKSLKDQIDEFKNSEIFQQFEELQKQYRDARAEIMKLLDF